MILNRREFLGGAVAVGSVLALPRLALGDEESRGAPRRTLVYLHLAGGNDGLNTVIPWKHRRYRILRPGLGIDSRQVRKIGDDLGLHPALAGMEALWKRDRLAIVNGVGYPQPSYSHFRSTEVWFTAEPEKTPTYGWIGRALDERPSDAPLRAVGLLKEKPLSLAASAPGIVTLTDFGQFAVPAGMEGTSDLYRRYADLAEKRGEVGRAGAQALEVAARIARLKPAGGPYQGRLGQELAKTMALLQADLGLECIQLQMGGYDTHSNQTPGHQRLLTELGNNLNVFQQQLEQKGLGDRVVTLVMSEFGRRAKENLSGGTDHGSAGPVFVVGQGIANGFHGAYPSLDDLDRDNFRFTTDFRRIYAAVLAHAFAMDPKPVLGDFQPLELFA
jgi:uncharacterized protein (DUF1501 family)